MWLSAIKVKVNCTLVQALRLCTSHIAHRGSRGIALLFHDHGTRRGWGDSVCPAALYTRERPGTHCTGGWVGPRAGLDRCVKSRPHRDFFFNIYCLSTNNTSVLNITSTSCLFCRPSFYSIPLPCHTLCRLTPSALVRGTGGRNFDPRTVQPVASRYTDYGNRP